MTAVQDWFNNLRRNEQLILLFGAAFVLCYLFYIMVWSPISADKGSFERQNIDAMHSLENVRQLAAQYKQLNTSGAVQSSGGQQNLATLVDTSVKNNQLQYTRLQPSSSGDVQLRFENAVFNNLLAWIDELGVQHSVIVKDLSVSPGVAPGQVNVSIRLHKGA